MRAYKISVDGSGNGNGDEAVTSATEDITTNKTNTIELMDPDTESPSKPAANETACLRGPQLRLKAVLSDPGSAEDGTILGYSKPFAVSAIPVDWTESEAYDTSSLHYFLDYVTYWLGLHFPGFYSPKPKVTPPGQTVGFVANLSWQSDDGNLKDLGCTEISELLPLDTIGLTQAKTVTGTLGTGLDDLTTEISTTGGKGIPLPPEIDQGHVFFDRRVRSDR